MALTRSEQGDGQSDAALKTLSEQVRNDAFLDRM